jgi:hypothetical protein
MAQTKRLETLNHYICSNAGKIKPSLTDSLYEYQSALKLKGKKFLLDSLHSNQLLEYSNTIQDIPFLTRIKQDAELLFEQIVRENPDIFVKYSGRIKSLIETEKKLNMLIYKTPILVKEQSGEDAIPTIQDYISNLERFRDTIGLRFIFDGLPEEELIKRISYIANMVIPFMIQLGYIPEKAVRPIEVGGTIVEGKLNIDPDYLPFFKDYISNPKTNSYQSLHIVFREKTSGRFVEIQFRTLKMHLEAECGKAHHDTYKANRYSQNVTSCPEIAKALKRAQTLKKLDLAKVNIRGFAYTAEQAKNDTNIDPIIDFVGLIKPRLLSQREKL